MGPGKSYTGLLGTVRTADGYCSRDYVGQEMFITGRGLYLRGPSFLYANDGASPVRNNCITDEHN